MASITIRNLDDDTKKRLRIRAAEHGWSMEEEVRYILRDALAGEDEQSLADLATELFGPEHGVELEEHPPVTAPPPPRFGLE